MKYCGQKKKKRDTGWTALVDMCVHGCVCLCLCARVRVVVDTAICVPRGLQMQSEPLLWPDLCKFFPLWNYLCSPVKPHYSW